MSEIRALRRRDDIPLSNLPRTKEQATAELAKFRSGDGISEYKIRNRRSARVSPEKRYAQALQEEINERLKTLKDEFLERESKRRAM